MYLRWLNIPLPRIQMETCRQDLHIDVKFLIIIAREVADEDKFTPVEKFASVFVRESCSQVVVLSEDAEPAVHHHK